LSRSRRIALSAALAAALLTGLADAAATVPRARSVRPSAPVRLDGLVDDWTNVPRIADPNSGAEMAFQNDARHLYILMTFTKPESAEAAQASGMTVLGAPGGKAKDAKGALFLRREVSAEAYIGWRERQGDLLTDKDKDEIRRFPRHPVSLAYAIDVRGRTYGPLSGRSGATAPEFGLRSEDGSIVYEFSLPLDPPAEVPGGIRGAPGTTVRLTLNWGGPGRKSLSPHTGRESPGPRSGDLSGAGLTWAQEFIDTFDSMSRPTIGTKKYSFAVDLELAGKD
jgi:hypothetical protein